MIFNLDQLARALESAGAELCDWSRAAIDPEPATVQRLINEIERLVKHMRRFPSVRGRHYLKGLGDAAVATVSALERIATLLPRSGLSLIESYQWNQTRRLRDYASSSHEHLLMVWERWLGQLSDAADEIRRISTGEIGESSDEDSSADLEEDGSDEEWMRQMARKMTEGELAMARECLALVKTSRSLCRRVKVKLINSLGPGDSPHEIQLIDELHEIGDSLVIEADNLATALFPVQDNLVIREMAIRLAMASQSLADLARMHTADGASQRWFEACYQQLDQLIVPVLERTPFR